VSIPDRLFRISKAYLNQVRDRIDAELAERELDAGLAPGGSLPAGGESDSASTLREEASVRAAEEMMRQAEAKIAAARREMENRSELDPERGVEPVAGPAPRKSVPATVKSTTPNTSNVTPNEDPNARDYRVLGVPAGSDLATVQSAYEKLARRCDPRRFPDGSQEQKDAEQILERVNAAYDALRNRLDPTQNRFGKLELE